MLEIAMKKGRSEESYNISASAGKNSTPIEGDNVILLKEFTSTCIYYGMFNFLFIQTNLKWKNK